MSRKRAVWKAPTWRALAAGSIEGSAEVMLVTNVAGVSLTVARGYGATTAESLVNNSVIRILGNASLEGDDAATARFTNRVRKSNYTQIFAATVEVSGSELAVRRVGVKNELNYQSHWCRHPDCSVLRFVQWE